MKRLLTSVAAAALIVGGLAACSSGNDSSTTTTSPSSSGASSTSSGSGKLTIFAASSLINVFGTLKTQFEAEHPAVQVVLSFGSSTTLAQQITAGAPADVIATADQASISDPQKAGQLEQTPVQFATNTLTIAVPPDNPGSVTSVDSLNTADYVMCDPSAPCGAAGAQMLKNAGITAKPKAFEPDVATVLTQIELGEADAGIVYVTDAQGAGSKVKAVTIPASDNVTNPYFIATVKGSSQQALAMDWLTLVTSPAGQSVLREAGFGAP